MRTPIRLLVIAAVALVTITHGATYTNYLEEVQAVLQGELDEPATPDSERKLVRKALARLSGNSRSVSGDYRIFIAVMIDLHPLPQAGNEMINLGLSNAFRSFVLEAEAQILALDGRLASITPFQPLRSAATNKLAQASRALSDATNAADLKVSQRNLRSAFVGITVASKFTARAEARQGNALVSFSGQELGFDEKEHAGNFRFSADGTYAGVTIVKNIPRLLFVTEAGTYTYQRTGLNSGTLNLHLAGVSASRVFQLRFKSADGDDTRGTYVRTDIVSTGAGVPRSGMFVTARRH